MYFTVQTLLCFTAHYSAVLHCTLLNYIMLPYISLYFTKINGMSLCRLISCLTNPSLCKPWICFLNRPVLFRVLGSILGFVHSTCKETGLIGLFVETAEINTYFCKDIQKNQRFKNIYKGIQKYEKKYKHLKRYINIYKDTNIHKYLQATKIYKKYCCNYLTLILQSRPIPD